MLSKLLKKDFHSTCRFFIPLLCGYAVAAVVGKILFEIVLAQSHFSYNNGFFDAITIFAFLYGFIFIVYLIACYLMTSVFIVYDFYKTMVSDHGYLTHTLPVKTSTLIWSKTLMSAFWHILVHLILGLSVLLLFTGHFKNIPLMDAVEYFLYFFNSELKNYSFYTVLNMIISLFNGPLMFFCCIAIGQLWKNHRVLGAILSYIGMYVSMQILSTIALVTVGGGSVFYHSASIFYNGYLTFATLFALITTVLFFWVTNHILSNHLNLE